MAVIVEELKVSLALWLACANEGPIIGARSIAVVKARFLESKRNIDKALEI
jgi:hypothetical protein